MRQRRPTMTPQSARPPRRQRQTFLVVGAVLLPMAALVVWALLGRGRDEPIDSQAPRSAAETTTTDHEQPTVQAERPSDPASSADTAIVIADDGSTLWAAPTTGEPVDLGYLPPGCQMFLVLRPAALFAHAEGDKVFAALGPSGKRGMQFVEQATHLRFTEIDQLVIGLRANSLGEWQASFVVRAIESALVENVLANLQQDVSEPQPDDRYIIRGPLAYFTTGAEKNALLVVTPATDAADVLALAGNHPPLRRDMEQLLATSNDQYHVNLFFAPNYLHSDGKSIFTDVAVRLAEPLDWLLGDGLTAVELSMHWCDNFFLELRATATIDTRSHVLARRLQGRVSDIPAQVKRYVTELNAQPYGRELLARLPAMCEALASYTRQGDENECAVLRTYLPLAAGHNLLASTELALVEPLRSSTSDASAVVSGEGELTVEERLAQRISLSFNRESLETALELLAAEIGMTIRIEGADLQLEGITRNQMLALDVQDRPASEALMEILRRANPDKSATGSDDPRQKLVYVERQPADAERAVVLVTTRAAALRRGEALPAAFRGP